MSAKSIPNLSLWQQLAPEVGYNANALAGRLKLSVRTLERQCRAALRRSPQDWLDDLRVERMKEMMRQRYLLKQITPEVGLKQDSHASRFFKTRAHLTMEAFVAQLSQEAITPPAPAPAAPPPVGSGQSGTTSSTAAEPEEQNRKGQKER